MTTLIFKLFKKEHFPEYLSWFQDAELNKHLGPLKENDEWLNYVIREQEGLTENKGCTYSVFQNTDLVSVIGIAFPDKEHPTYCITNIAVKPSLRATGIGSRILQNVRNLHLLKKGEYWSAHVDEKNPKAKLFFENNGWDCVTQPPQNNGMYLFVFGK